MSAGRRIGTLLDSQASDTFGCTRRRSRNAAAAVSQIGSRYGQRRP